MKHLDRDAVAAHTLIALPWWREDKVSRFALSKNMRAEHDSSYADFCMEIGDGTRKAPDADSMCEQMDSAVVSIPTACSCSPDDTPLDITTF